MLPRKNVKLTSRIKSKICPNVKKKRTEKKESLYTPQESFSKRQILSKKGQVYINKQLKRNNYKFKVFNFKVCNILNNTVGFNYGEIRG